MDRKWLGVFTVLAAVAFMTALGLGLGSPLVLALIAIVMVGSLVLLFRKSDRPTEYVYGSGAPKTFTWWTGLALLLATTYIVGATAQLISDPKGTNVGALGIAIGFAGLIAGGLRLRSQSKITGNWLIIFGTVPALMFFWIIVPAVVALAVIVGAVTEISHSVPREPLPT